MINDYIAVDWGSTNLRAWRYQNGQCIDQLHAQAGVTQLKAESPQHAFTRLLSPWLRQQALPVGMAGMIGSNAGWIEAPYIPCPANLRTLGQRLVPAREALPVKAWIVPGLCVDRGDNRNVMRGEETQLIGAHRLQPSGLYLLPGTHCKWVQVRADRVTDFRTVMTGELHHLMLKQSLIGTGLPEQHADADIFQQGLELGSNDSNILGRLFETRAARVLGRLPASAVSDWLSGLLIGNEVAQMQRQWAVSSHSTMTVVGNSGLAQRYLQALALAGLPATTVDGDLAFQTGIRSIVNDLAD